MFDKLGIHCHLGQMPQFSLIVIAKNEAHNIARCLDSVPFAAEKIVVDSGSEDHTVAVAQSCGARVIHKDWAGFYQQRVFATSQAQNEWVLFLDADEALSAEAQRELQTWSQSTPQAPAYAFPRLSFHLGRWICHGGWYPDWQIRLFDRREARWVEGEVHEKVQAANILRFQHPLHHWVFEDLSDQVETNNRYSSLGAKELQRRGRSFSALQLLIRPWIKFFETYLWKRGFLDGWPGFMISVGAAYSMFLKHAKHWEMQRVNRSRTVSQSERPN